MFIYRTAGHWDIFLTNDIRSRHVAKPAWRGVAGRAQTNTAFGNQSELHSNLSSTASYAHFGKLFIFSKPQFLSQITLGPSWKGSNKSY